MFEKSQSIPSLFVQIARECPEKTALRVPRANSFIDISWESFLEVVCYLSLGLNDIGLNDQRQMANNSAVY